METIIVDFTNYSVICPECNGAFEAKEKNVERSSFNKAGISTQKCPHCKKRVGLADCCISRSAVCFSLKKQRVKYEKYDLQSL